MILLTLNATLNCTVAFTLRIYVNRELSRPARDCFEKGFMYAKAYDELPLTDTHTSFLVRGNVYDKRNTSSMTDRNKVAEELGHLLESDSYRQLKDNERMKALVAAYLPLCGEKAL